MGDGFYYALGNLIADASLYFLAIVPFWGKERIKRRYVIFLLVSVLFVRVTAAFIFIAFVPNGVLWNGYFYIAYMAVILAAYLICYKIHVAKLLYTMLILALIGTLVNYIKLAILSFFHQGDVLSTEFFSTTPISAVVMAVLWALILPFAYRLFKNQFRSAFSLLSNKSISMLCVMPAMFNLLLNVYAIIFHSALFREAGLSLAAEMLFDLSVMLTGLVSCFINIYMVLNTAKYKYESAFARDMIATGSDYYKKMNEMYDTLRILRHDHKYHLAVINKLLHSGGKGEVEKYLIDIQKEIDKKELPYYCSNTVLNALLASYAERCEESNIAYSVKIAIPDDLFVSAYEMCIVLGNLLENAVEACRAYNGSRKIEVAVNTKDSILAIMVKNNCNGITQNGNGGLVSKKKRGGLGLRSIQAVAAQHGGELMTEQDGDMFTAYVLMKG